MSHQEPWESLSPDEQFRFQDHADELIQTDLPLRYWVAHVEEAVHLSLTLRNGGPLPAAFNVEELGLPSDWMTVLPETLLLNPGQQQQVTVVLNPPRLAGSRAGEHRFVLKITSPVYPGRYSQHWVVLRINPFYEFILSPLSPKWQALSWSNPSAEYLLGVENKGNAPATFHLESHDLHRGCHFEYRLPGQAVALTGQVDFSLAPGEQASIPVQVTPTAKPLLGWPRTYPFTVTVTAFQGQRLPRSVLGQLVNKPLIGPGMLAMLTFSLLVFFMILLGPLLESAWQGTPVVLKLQTKEEKVPSKGPGLLLFLRSFKATPMPPAEPPKRPTTYEEMFQEIAVQHNLDWRVLEAVAYHESRMNYLALGRSKDMGLMQVIPSTWNQWAPKVGVYDPYDPYSNIAVGAAYLAYVRDFCARRGYSEPHWMLVAYNWGPQRVDQLFAQGGGWEQVPPTQQHYALSILEMATNRAAGLATGEQFYTNIPAPP